MKYIVGTIAAFTALALGLWIFIPTQKASNIAPGSNVAMIDGVQVIDLTAKGGYAPQKTTAAAGVPTKLEIETDGTVDCSSTVLIPSLSVSEQLPLSGTTELDLGNPAVGTLQGTCGMGMYRFEIEFTDQASAS
jgi:plastocyanin domain-containing protein